MLKRVFQVLESRKCVVCVREALTLLGGSKPSSVSSFLCEAAKAPLKVVSYNQTVRRHEARILGSVDVWQRT